ncbi:hypothetical protein ACNTMW_27770 [Planosporangium sp. 12N6]|uniref:hypothetical protein n=1 Tax=Planosporangium spinosum TaxID=3402278 RepID=UPI003CF43C79
MSADLDGLGFDELDAIARAVADWAHAAELLERRADALVDGLPALERAWDSTAGRAYADTVRTMVAGLRATADLARYNQAQLLAAADATDEALSSLHTLAASGGPARNGTDHDAARDVVGTLHEVYANAAARLTAPRIETGAAFDVTPGRPGPVVSFVPPDSQARTSAPADQATEDGGPADEVPEIDLDTDLPDVVDAPVPVRRAGGTPTGGPLSRFPVTPGPAVPPVLPATAPSVVPPARPVDPRSGAERAVVAGRPGAERAVAAERSMAGRSVAARSARRGAEETYIDARGHRIHIRWSAEAIERPEAPMAR